MRRGQVTTPLKDVLIAVPAKLGQELKIVTKAYFVNSTLVSTTGGYMGKYQESGEEADDLAPSSPSIPRDRGARVQAQIDAGSDDDGGRDTPA